MNDEIGKVVDHQFDRVLGRQVELQTRRTRDGYRSEWSFDGGDNWNCHLKVYSTSDEAMAKARAGAFVNCVHQKVKVRRQADG